MRTIYRTPLWSIVSFKVNPCALESIVQNTGNILEVISAIQTFAEHGCVMVLVTVHQLVYMQGKLRQGPAA